MGTKALLRVCVSLSERNYLLINYSKCYRKVTQKIEMTETHSKTHSIKHLQKKKKFLKTKLFLTQKKKEK